MGSLEVTDKESAAVATHPRVTLDEIKNSIYSQHYISGADITLDGRCKELTICMLVMNNGFTVIGKAAPASPENFNSELGQKFAYEDAVRQIWPLMGYALRDKLAKA